MSNLTMTIILAFFIIVIAMSALAISWLFKGKSTIKAGSCGRDPTKKQNDESCGTKRTCGLCEDKDKDCNTKK